LNTHPRIHLALVLKCDVVIPDTYNGTPVTDVADFGGSAITSVTFPDSVTTIRMSAFDGCTGIRSITFPASVTKIDYHAFKGCTNLTSVTFKRGDATLASGRSPSFPGDLYTKYTAGGAGTYTRSPGGTVWTKQGGRPDPVEYCPTCGQPLPKKR